MMSPKAFANILPVQYSDLLEYQNELNSVRDQRYDMLANICRDKLASTLIGTEVKLVCKALWESAKRTLNILENTRSESSTKFSDCCHGFFVSETWLEEKLVGDTFLICESWDEYSTCFNKVKEVFPAASESRWEELALQIVRTRAACKIYFNPSSANNVQINLDLIKNVHHLLTSFKPDAPELDRDSSMSDFRKAPSSSDSALPFLNHQVIAAYLNELLTFVNGQVTTTLEEILLLAVLFFERFLWIHPFAEGNGRTARFLFSMILKSRCIMVPLPMFLRTCKNPRAFYMDSIRANPSKAPVCLAFYVLKCLNENSLRLLEMLSPGALLKRDDISENDLNTEQTRVWSAVCEVCPSLMPSDIVWLDRSGNGFLLIIGTESYNDENAVVHRVHDIERVRALTFNKTWTITKVLRRSELFSSSEYRAPATYFSD